VGSTANLHAKSLSSRAKRGKQFKQSKQCEKFRKAELVSFLIVLGALAMPAALDMHGMVFIGP
jgi:hypothetical protein